MKEEYLKNKDGEVVSPITNVDSVKDANGDGILKLLSQKVDRRTFAAVNGTKQDKLTFDTTPTAGSANPVTSGGVKAAIDAVVNDANSRFDYLTDEIIAMATRGSVTINQSGDITDLDEAVTVTVSEYFEKIRRACRLVSWDGTLDQTSGEPVLKEVSRSDKTLYKDGTDRDETEDLFVEIPAMWYKCEESGGAGSEIWTMTISLASDFTPDEEDTRWKYFKKRLIGAYCGYVDENNKLRSLTGKTSPCNISHADFSAYARNMGTGFTMVDYDTYKMLQWIYCGIYNTFKVTSVIGELTAGPDYNYFPSTGLVDSFGMTDTTPTSFSGSVRPTNFLGIDSIFGDNTTSQYMDNLISIDDNYLIGVYGTDQQTPLRSIQSCRAEGNYNKKLIMGEYGDFLPKESGIGVVGFHYADINVVRSGVGAVHAKYMFSLLMANTDGDVYYRGRLLYTYADNNNVESNEEE